MSSLEAILEMSNSEIDALYEKSVGEAVAAGQKDIKFAVSSEASVSDVKRAQLAIEQAHRDGLTTPAEGL